MNRDDRINAVHDFMGNQFVPNVKAKAISEELWPGMISLTQGADVHRLFGYSNAQFFSYDDKWAFFYCASVIADTTAELTDPLFADWLRYIRAHTTAHASLRTEDEAVVDEAVFAVMPEARPLVAAVHDQMFVF